MEARFSEDAEWAHERWWYKLAQVCRRWRRLVLGSASHLDLCLLCTHGTPVADMLAHSPPLPLIIDYLDESQDITAEDEENIMLALQHHDRVRRIRLKMPILNLRKIITVAIGEEFPMLEYLYIGNLANAITRLILPETFRAPHLQHLLLEGVVDPIGSPFLSAAVGLVTLFLSPIPLSAYFPPNDFLSILAVLPQLEILGIAFLYPIPNRDVEWQLLHMPIMTRVTLPNLRWFLFKGVCAYLEALLPHITTPLLEMLQIVFFNQLTISLPCLRQFTTTTEKLRFHCARLKFDEKTFSVGACPREWGAAIEPLFTTVDCAHLDWQVASLAQISTALRTIFSVVEDLTLEYSRSSISPEWHNEADRAQWRELLRSFSNVKTLSVPDGLIGELSRSLQLDDGESPTELLPELKELSFPASSESNPDADDAFTAFAQARQNAGHSFVLVRR
jgi:hypothetical protein